VNVRTEEIRQVADASFAKHLKRASDEQRQQALRLWLEGFEGRKQ
jgi:hypothetical protein